LQIAMMRASVLVLLASSFVLPLATAHPISPYLDVRANPRPIPLPALYSRGGGGGGDRNDNGDRGRERGRNGGNGYGRGRNGNDGGNDGGDKTLNIGIGAVAIGGGNASGTGVGSIGAILTGLQTGEIKPNQLTDEQLAAMEGLGDAEAAQAAGVPLEEAAAEGRSAYLLS
jgi:hypothetical protein